MVASSIGLKAVVKVLLEHADGENLVEAKDEEGHNAYDLALSYDRLEVAERCWC